MEVGRSFKLGVIRLTERFVKSDPLAPRDERKLNRYSTPRSASISTRSRRAGFDRVIGTSGTILSLGAVAQAERNQSAGASLRNRRISAKQLRRTRKTLVSRDLQERLRVPGLEPRRADLAVAGAILLDAILRRLGADEITLCDLSLREGLVLDYIARHRKEIVQADRYPDVRRRSVVRAGRTLQLLAGARAAGGAAVGRPVRSDARGARPDRSRARVAGVRRAAARHRRPHQLRAPSQALVLPDQERRSARVRAGRDRGDRAGRPLSPPGHAETHGTRATASFGRKRRRTIRTLAAILRLAEGLDRSHSQPIAGLELHDRGEDALLQLRTAGDAELELWAATRHAGAVRAADRQAAARRSRRERAADTFMLNNLTTPHEYPGKLLVVEGIDGSGKTTQLGLLAKWLSGGGPPRVRHRMELVRPGEGRDKDRQEKERPDADDVQLAARH